MAKIDNSQISELVSGNIYSIAGCSPGCHKGACDGAAASILDHKKEITVLGLGPGRSKQAVSPTSSAASEISRW